MPFPKLKKGVVKSASKEKLKEIVDYFNSEEGASFKPVFQPYLDSVETYNKNKGDKSQANIAAYYFDLAKKDPIEFAKNALDRSYTNYAVALRQKLPESEKNLKKENYESSINYLLKNKVTPTELTKLVADSETKTNDFFAANRKRMESSGVDKFFDVITPILASFALPALGSAISASFGVSAAVGNAIVNTAAGLVSGADPKTVLKNALAGLTAQQIGQYAVKLADIKDPNINKYLGSTISSGANAYIRGDDVGTAMLANIAGKAASDVTSAVTDNKNISSSAGDYAKAVTSGSSAKDALTDVAIDAGLGALKDKFSDVKIPGFTDTKTPVIKTPDIKTAEKEKDEFSDDATYNQILAAFEAPKSEGFGQQIGLPTASTTLATLPGYTTTDAPAGSDVAGIFNPTEVVGEKNLTPAEESDYLDQLKKAAISGDTSLLTEETKFGNLPDVATKPITEEKSYLEDAKYYQKLATDAYNKYVDSTVVSSITKTPESIANELQAKLDAELAQRVADEKAKLGSGTTGGSTALTGSVTTPTGGSTAPTGGSTTPTGGTTSPTGGTTATTGGTTAPTGTTGGLPSTGGIPSAGTGSTGTLPSIGSGSSPNIVDVSGSYGLNGEYTGGSGTGSTGSPSTGGTGGTGAGAGGGTGGGGGGTTQSGLSSQGVAYNAPQAYYENPSFTLFPIETLKPKEDPFSQYFRLGGLAAIKRN